MKEELTSSAFSFVNDDPFDLFFGTIAEGIIIVNQAWEIVWTNKSADEMFGYTEGELTDKPLGKLVPKNYHSIHGEHLKEYFENPVTRMKDNGLDLIGLKKDGLEFPVEISLSHFSHNNENLSIAFITDISKGREEEANLLTERKLSAKYFNIAEVFLLVLNKEAEIVRINDHGCEMLGYDRNDLIGKNWMDSFIVKNDEEKIYEVFDSVATDSNKYESFENWIKTKSGEERLIHWKNTTLLSEHDNVIGTLSSGTDITEKNRMLQAVKENEERLQDYSKNLEKQVEERTRELEKSLEKERDLGAMKSKFVSLASHEFRTPLSTILSSASLIARYPDTDMNEKRMKHVDRIKSSVVHLNGILEDFLSLDRLEEGKIICQPEEFDLKELLEEVVSTLEEIRKPGQELEFKCNGKPCLLNTDKKLVRNILYNLTSNALKYSPENKPVTISTLLEKKEAFIEIKDEGIGIPEEEQEQLFSRFFRASNTRGYQGTGLGLNIVKKYVNLLQGEISFESGRGVGTTFYVKFPATLTS